MAERDIPLVFQHDQDGRDQLFGHPQEIEVEAISTGAHQRGHETSQLDWSMAGRVYRWSGLAYAYWSLSVGAGYQFGTRKVSPAYS